MISSAASESIRRNYTLFLQLLARETLGVNTNFKAVWSDKFSALFWMLNCTDRSDNIGFIDKTEIHCFSFRREVVIYLMQSFLKKLA